MIRIFIASLLLLTPVKGQEKLVENVDCPSADGESAATVSLLQTGYAVKHSKDVHQSVRNEDCTWFCKKTNLRPNRWCSHLDEAECKSGQYYVTLGNKNHVKCAWLDGRCKANGPEKTCSAVGGAAQDVSATGAICHPYSPKASGKVCTNRGAVAGSSKYSTNFWNKCAGKTCSADACAAYVQSTPGCGKWFNYGQNDGWCDCVKEGDGPCTESEYIGYGYGVYKLDHQPPPPSPTEIAYTIDTWGKYCTNRGGSWASNKYSKHIGTKSQDACAAYVMSTTGCGKWFNYNVNDGWCDCVKVEDGDCVMSAGKTNGAGVFKLA
jgi:hypothetical protein